MRTRKQLCREDLLLAGRTTIETSPRWQDFMPACLLLCVCLLALAWMVARPAPRQQEVAVLLSPADGLPEAEALARRVGAQLVDTGGLPNVFVFKSAQSDFIETLYRSGAWLVINPLTVRGCSAASRSTQGH